jgi:hypothetical protein
VTGHRRTMASPRELGATGMSMSSGGAGRRCVRRVRENGDTKEKNIKGKWSDYDMRVPNTTLTVPEPIWLLKIHLQPRFYSSIFKLELLFTLTYMTVCID